MTGTAESVSCVDGGEAICARVVSASRLFGGGVRRPGGLICGAISTVCCAA